MLTLASKESHFLFDRELYHQVYGVAMSSPLVSTLWNNFLCHHEDILVRDCLLECKATIKNDMQTIFLYLLSRRFNLSRSKLSWTFDILKWNLHSKNNKKIFNFLNVKVVRENNVSTTLVYHKPSFSDVYTHFGSYMQLNYKFSLVSTIIFCTFSMCFDMTKFHQEICKIKGILKIIVTVKGLLTNVLKHSSINYLFLKEQLKLLKRNN